METEGKIYRYIVVGTGYINVTASSHLKGRVLVLSVILGPSGSVEVRRRYQIPCEAPVYSLAPYSSSSLVYCSGHSINMRTLNTQTKKFDVVAEKKLRSPAVQITVAEPWIHLSCGEDSMLVLKFEDDKFNELFSDEVARNGFHHFQLLQGFFLATDKELGVVGLWQPPDRRNVESLVTVVEAELTSSISRIRQGNLRPPWCMRRTPPGTKTSGKDLIASGIDGSMFHLTLLEEDSLHLLRYIQDLYRTKAGIGRHSPHGAENGVRDPRMGHVDGDILVAVLKLGNEWLREVLMKLDETGGSALAGFTELVGKVQGILQGESDPVDAAMKYMNELVHGVVL
ncbi:hypothetical protein C7212DRAFT_351525 [Tuber magnatum]|uniref:RSE1/DDB1/CPSF1 C-terminal domain-containing protein n=1 Tax=Tuber magnatum TaxID=42249 RepID=A0A317SPW8_9PEZI|nr:hypothetical protein C7212DRAFT_351525 [Tuber magnatum]